jgi:hypothetical protein
MVFKVRENRFPDPGATINRRGGDFKKRLLRDLTWPQLSAARNFKKGSNRREKSKAAAEVVEASFGVKMAQERKRQFQDGRKIESKLPARLFPKISLWESFFPPLLPGFNRLPVHSEQLFDDFFSRW